MTLLRTVVCRIRAAHGLRIWARSLGKLSFIRCIHPTAAAPLNAVKITILAPKELTGRHCDRQEVHELASVIERRISDDADEIAGCKSCRTPSTPCKDVRRSALREPRFSFTACIDDVDIDAQVRVIEAILGDDTLERHQLRRATLVTVLWINGVMFAVEFLAGVWADSSALVADSADNLGDALTYAISLYVLHRSLRWRGGAAMIKGAIQIVFGVGVLLGIGYKVVHGFEPLAPAMAGVSALALAANLTCFLLLLKHRSDDINMRSVWLCSRNDVLGNIGVLLAAGMVALTGTFWPDVAVGTLLAVLFVWTGVGVIREAAGVWQAERLSVGPEGA